MSSSKKFCSLVKSNIVYFSLIQSNEIDGVNCEVDGVKHEIDRVNHEIHGVNHVMLSNTLNSSQYKYSLLGWSTYGGFSQDWYRAACGDN